nr:reverse transcriptase domain-containing protein [Tanacetum cinerariifolium]GEZ37237.1 reverse transcriptase domain-containing protein [Tanacetum cinerariifolium]
MDAFDRDLRDEVQFSSVVENRVTKLKDNDQEKMDKMERMEKRLETLGTNYALSNVEAMMITEYCPSIEIQRTEQELWNFTLKGDDIEAYNNCFHELALMCLDLVTPKKKKIDGHQEKDCRVRLPGAGDNPLQNATCYGCGEKGHLKNKFPRRINQQNEGAHARSYVMRTENPRQKDPKSLSYIKADEKKLEDIPIVSDFLEEEAFRILKKKLCNTPVLALPDGPNDFVVYCDASNQGFGCMLMQWGKVIAYDSRQLKTHEKNCITYNLELGIRKLIMDEAHSLRYLVHPGANKMNYDLRDLCWWPGMKKDIANNGYDAIWVIVDRLTKSAHFLPIREDFKMESSLEGVRTRLDMSTAYDPQTDGQITIRALNAHHLRHFTADHVLLKASPWKIVVRFGKKGKCCDTFHVSNLKKCLAEMNLQVPLEEIKIDDKLYFVEEPVEIMERDVTKLKQS